MDMTKQWTNTQNSFQNKRILTHPKAPKDCMMNITLLALCVPLLKMQSLWPKPWTKSGCVQQAPNTHLWLIPSHLDMVPYYFFCNSIVDIIILLDSLCHLFYSLRTSSGNASVVGSTTFYSIYSSLFSTLWAFRPLPEIVWECILPWLSPCLKNFLMPPKTIYLLLEVVHFINTGEFP